MSPADGELGNVTVIAPPDVFTKYPTLLAAVNGEVFAVVQNNTAEAGSPNPDCVAPGARLTAPPHLPNVTVAPSATMV